MDHSTLKTFSIVLLAHVDAQYKFLVIDIGAYGKNSDREILSNSNLGKAIEINKLNILNNQYLPDANEKLLLVIIEDEAFPFKKYLLKPYPEPQMYEDQWKKIFNGRLSST